MTMHRKREYFEYPQPSQYISSANTPPQLYKQERDWTCAIACIRTILSGVTDNVRSEDEYIQDFHLSAGPHFVREILDKNMLSSATEVKSHLDFDKAKLNLQLLLRLLQQKYFIMVESMYNYDHWLVVLGYFATQDREDTETHRVLVYDPYYDQVRLFIAEEFETMWCSPDGHFHEFIAIR